MDELDFNADDFADILSRDSRYNARAYTLLMDCIGYISSTRRGHFTAADVLDEFRERALDQFGPLTYTVLTEWGLSCTEDIGEMMFNLADSSRIKRDDSDSSESFVGGYDFKEAFLAPYQA